jgi:hypothetical protein
MLPMEKVAGKLEVGLTEDICHIVIRHRESKRDRNGVGHIQLSPRHARHLANVLLNYAAHAEAEATRNHSNVILPGS